MRVDQSRDQNLTDFSKATLKDRYLLENETYQGLFERVAKAYCNDDNHAQRLYDYMSNLWFMPATPILSNGGTDRGMPISCFLNEANDNMSGIIDTWSESSWLACKGGGIGTYWGNIRSIDEKVGTVGKSSGVIPFLNVQDSLTLAISQGCVDGETEILTEKGWIKFEDLNESHGKVMQINYDFTMSFTDVQEYHKYAYNGKMHHYTNEANTIDHLVTPNHRMSIEKEKSRGGFTGKLEEVVSEKFNPHRDNRVYTTGNNINNKNEIYRLTALEKFLIAYQADGSTKPIGTSNGNSNGCLAYNFHFTKKRKINRLREILEELDFYYSETILKDGSTNFYVSVPKNVICEKEFSWVNLTKISTDWATAFIYELINWDGSINKTGTTLRYDNTVKKAADVVSSVACIAGFKCFVSELQREAPRKTLHKVHICTTRNTIGGESISKTELDFDGYVYCVSVPNGRFLSRRNGRILVTGNSLRRGSSAIYLPVNHPEIEEFIEIRKPTGGDPNRKTLNLHHGVVIDDKFMTAVENDTDYDLISPNDGSVVETIKARALWMRMLTTRIETGEPYMLFIDNVNRAIPKPHKDLGLKVKTSNLCTEITLPTGTDHLGNQRTAVCCLSSLNLEKYDEWKNNENFIIDVLYFLDNVLQSFIDTAPDSHAKAKYAAMRERSIGLGVMGLHYLYQKRGVAFGSKEAYDMNKKIFDSIGDQVNAANILIGMDRGSCLDAQEAGYPNMRFMNATSIAPTASISVICGNVSPGVEPQMANVFIHKTLSGSFEVRNPYLEVLLEALGKNTQEVWRQITLDEGSVRSLDFLTKEQKEIFLTASEIDQLDIIYQGAHRQPNIDQAQSINIFLPSNVNKTYLHKIHFLAWKLGLKSLYYCRSSSLKRAEKASAKVAREVIHEVPKYEECEACQ